MKIVLLTSLVIFSCNSYSQTHECEETPPFAEDIEKIQRKINFWSASDEEISSAFCKTKTAPTLKEMKAYNQKVMKGTGNSGVVHGVSFANDSKVAIATFSDLTTYTHTIGQMIWPKGQTPIQEKFEINPGCNKVSCAIDKIWGEELGTRLVYIYHKYGFNASELAHMHSRRFDPKDLDEIMKGLNDMPESFFPIGKNRRLARFQAPPTAPADPNSKVVADANITLFDNYFKNSDLSKHYTIFHEVSHNHAYNIGKNKVSADYDPKWLALSGWEKKGMDWSNAGGGCFTSVYGETNPAEDWAEAMSAYRYNGVKFKASCPEKYAYMKENVFNGLEYTSEKACQSKP